MNPLELQARIESQADMARQQAHQLEASAQQLFDLADGLDEIAARVVVEDPDDPDTLLPAAYSKDVHPRVATKMPGYLRSVEDPYSGAWITRVTGDAGVEAVPGSTVWTKYNRHVASKVCPWNVDSTLMIVKAQGAQKLDGTGAPEYLLLNGQTHEVIKALYPLGSSGQVPEEMRWTNKPHELLCVGGNEIWRWDVTLEKATSVCRIEGAQRLFIGPYEGNMNHACDQVVVMNTNDRLDRSRKGWLVYLDSGTPISLGALVFDMPDLDHCCVSASGKYLTVTGRWIEPSSHWRDGDRTWWAGPEGNRKTDRYGGPSHWDFGFNSEGEESIFGVEKEGTNNGRLLSVRLSDGQETYHTDGGYISHTSGRNVLLPGYAVVNYTGHARGPYQDEVCVVSLDGSMNIVRVAKTMCEDWYAEAVPSPDCKQIAWTSNWGNISGPKHVFVARIP